MVEAKQRVFEREHNGRAWLAFHIAHLPHQKNPISLSKLMITPTETGEPGKPVQSWVEIETTMRQWRFAMVASQAPQGPALKPNPRR